MNEFYVEGILFMSWGEDHEENFRPTSPSPPPSPSHPPPPKKNETEQKQSFFSTESQ